jgi:Holliday junction resolvase RusA-like endonuclease
MVIIIPIAPITKKNHQQIFRNQKTGKPFVTPSPQYKQYLEDCRYFLKYPKKPIDYKVNVKAIYYMPTHRQVDLINLHEALHDALVHYGIVKDDNSNIIHSTDGSYVDYDKENPRTEVEITKL